MGSRVDQSPETLLAHVRSAANLDQLSQALDLFGTAIENLMATQHWNDVVKFLYEVVQGDAQATAPDVKSAYRLTLRRVAKPSLFRALATNFAGARADHPKYLAILARYGEEAAEALIEQLVYAEQAKERRALFDGIVHLRAGVSTLIYMLQDRRWYAARNAADLLGEMGAADAEGALIECLRHDEARVRRSAAGALAKLGTPGALAARKAAMHHASPDVRMQATIAVATRKDPET